MLPDEAAYRIGTYSSSVSGKLVSPLRYIKKTLGMKAYELCLRPPGSQIGKFGPFSTLCRRTRFSAPGTKLPPG